MGAPLAEFPRLIFCQEHLTTLLIRHCYHDVVMRAFRSMVDIKVDKDCFVFLGSCWFSRYARGVTVGWWSRFMCGRPFLCRRTMSVHVGVSLRPALPIAYVVLTRQMFFLVRMRESTRTRKNICLVGTLTPEMFQPIKIDGI